MTTKRPSRARITERDATYLAFLSKFPAADAEAMSYLNTKAANPFGIEEGGLTEPSGIEKRLQKLIKLGAASKFRNPVSGINHYGATAFGNEAATFYGHTNHHWRSIDGLSISRLEHYRNIALIAAQFTSPINYFADIFNLNAVPFEYIISENETRGAYENINNLLKKQHTEDATTDFGAYRNTLIRKINDDVREGRLEPEDIVISYPQLLTIANEKEAHATRKPIHQPDLSIILDPGRRTRTNPKAQNILVEVELSLKTQDEYERILTTIDHELKQGSAYGRAIYFTNNTTIKQTIKRADTNAGTNLIQRNRMMILPIKGRDDNPRQTTTRVKVPKERPATVQTEEPLPDFN